MSVAKTGVMNLVELGDLFIAEVSEEWAVFQGGQSHDSAQVLSSHLLPAGKVRLSTALRCVEIRVMVLVKLLDLIASELSEERAILEGCLLHDRA
mmetsp:Transcript_13166/g.16753  ORF Transcript_13166/g.16753 Transcript_13166/m.16753 type:complete len:95 (-) Transcript_13166:775-1059(-)